MSISKNLLNIKSQLPNDVILVAVSKTKPISDIQEAYDVGQRHFGENRVQDMTEKWSQMPKDIKWHMIGNLQRNKVKYMAEYVHLIHSVDNLKLLKEINRQAKRWRRTIDCLLQIKIAEEDTKSGLSKGDAVKLLKSEAVNTFENIKIVGLMGMATFTDDEFQIKREFETLKDCFDDFKTIHNDLHILSMGMSGDYKLAIDCGSTMVRIGSTIFGTRNYG